MAIESLTWTTSQHRWGPPHPSSQAGAELRGHTETAEGLVVRLLFLSPEPARHQSPAPSVLKIVSLSSSQWPALTHSQCKPGFSGYRWARRLLFLLGPALLLLNRDASEPGGEHTLSSHHFGKCAHPRHQAALSRGNSWAVYVLRPAGGRLRPELTCAYLPEHAGKCSLDQINDHSNGKA